MPGLGVLTLAAMGGEQGREDREQRVPVQVRRHPPQNL